MLLVTQPSHGVQTMNQDQGTSELVDELCQEWDSTQEFIDKVNGTEIARKLLVQIERLQLSGGTLPDHHAH